MLALKLIMRFESKNLYTIQNTQEYHKILLLLRGFGTFHLVKKYGLSNVYFTLFFKITDLF